MYEKLSLKDKLLKYSKSKGYNKAQFCRFIGVSESFFTLNRGFTTDILQQILNKCADLNSEWLFRDEGEMILNPEKNSKLESQCDEKDALIEYLKEQLAKQTEMSQNLLKMFNEKN